jgi:uncharacterized protein YecE (DUF72 family)
MVAWVGTSVQLPPSQPRDDTRLAYFLQLVPHWIRVAVEFRHLSWHCAETFAQLAEREIAYCVAGQDVYVYFNNDGNANAVRNAHTLHALLATA